MTRTIRGMQLRNQRPDTAEDIAWRRASAEAGEQVNREREARYPVLTAENAAEAVKWQAARLEELTKYYLTLR